MTLLEYFKKEANNMLSIYPACFFEEEKHYSVIFPDFNYLSTCGDSLQDAMDLAVDCLAGALFSAKLDNEDIPIPSKLEEMDSTQISSELEFEFNNLLSPLYLLMLKNMRKHISIRPSKKHSQYLNG